MQMKAAHSSQLRDLDLVKYLENKLGDQNDLWSGRQASSLLSKEMLIELETCFQELEPHVKLKIIQAIPHLSPKLIQLWKEPLNTLLDVAKRDADDWVETVGDMYRDYPEKSCIRAQPSNPESQFCKTLEELVQMARTKVNDDTPKVVPPEAVIVSHSALKARYGYGEIEVKNHFSLRKQPKSQQLLNDVLKSADHITSPTSKKSHGIVSTVPIRMRSTLRTPNNSLPMRGIPAVNTAKISGGFTNEAKKFQRTPLVKREGGAKMIDIAELPPSLAKRRKAEAEEAKVRKAEEKAQKAEERARKAEERAKREEEKKAEMEHTKRLSTSEGESTDTGEQSISAEDGRNVAGESPPKSARAAFRNSSQFMRFVSGGSTGSASSSSVHVVTSSSSEGDVAASGQPEVKKEVDYFPMQQQPSAAPPLLQTPQRSGPQLNEQAMNLNYNMSFNEQARQMHPQQPQPAVMLQSPPPQQQPMQQPQMPIHLPVQATQNKQLDDLVRGANKLTRQSYNMIAAFLSGNMRMFCSHKLASRHRKILESVR
ncbi:Negative elongation factor A [Aphelenchoides avenae]|nr:Negative elongation factor A [Aphelenchus avenae]